MREEIRKPLLNMRNSIAPSAVDEQIKIPKPDMPPVNAPAHTYDELKKMRRNAYIKMTAIALFIVAVLAFGSIAWFTESREVEGRRLFIPY